MKKLGLFIFIDAFGWELMKRHAFLNDILTVKKPLDTVFGYSSTCDPTIITGKMPREHGHFSFFRYGPDNSPFRWIRILDLIPRFITKRGRIRNRISRIIKRLYGYTGYFQLYNMPFRYLRLFDYTEKRDIYESNGINNGTPTIFDFLRENKIPYYFSDWRAPEDENLKSVKTALEKGDVKFAYLYLAAMDADLHAHGKFSPIIEEKLKWYEAEIRKVYELAVKKYDNVNLYIFSDHGMTEVNDECALIAKIDQSGLRFGEDYAAVYDSTMARFWFFNENAREKISAILEGEKKGRILSDEELAEYGCDFPDNKYGELFFLLNPGVLLCPSFMGEKPLAGMHGYDPHDKDSKAIFASNTLPDPVPARLDDLYRLMKNEVTKETEFQKGWSF